MTVTSSRAARACTHPSGSAPLRPPTPDELDLADLLHALADNLLEAYDDRTGGLLVGGECGPEGISLHTKPLDGVHPADVLMGFTAPDSWWCLGVATTGTAHHLPPDAPPSATERLQTARRSAATSERVTIVHLTDRAGNTITVHRTENGERTAITDVGTGRIDDCCRRALGVPTAPPPSSTIALDAAEWLGELVDAAVGGRLDGADWLDVARLHPTAALADRLGFGELAATAADDLEAAAVRYAAAVGWQDLLDHARIELTGDRSRDPSDETEELVAIADWMDEGMYARLLLSRQPDPDEALAVLGALLPPSTVARIRAALETWGVLDVVDPPTNRHGSRAG